MAGSDDFLPQPVPAGADPGLIALARLMLLTAVMASSENAENVRIVATPRIRGTLTDRGDIRSEIDFQNDVNRLLARIEEARMPWTPAAALRTYAVGPLPAGYLGCNSVRIPLRVVDGGAPEAARRAPASPDQARYAATAPTTAVPSFSRR